ncbi:hypothetical protein AUC43_08630 [Hymenobacter sedentarius]|uniref:Uncharacterized protein n=1 Tax=Hymenobacter sedentarius TaxID=1411621 RepID=A0A0U4ANM8_9BACT|nr:hypothetical protein [Hymenobacter sedentarius]ALW85152.1 hypothetical protein AUC43_08630 [Hymenobacter sedentarius]
MAPFASEEINRLYLASERLVGGGLAVLSAWALLNLIVSGYFVARADRRYEAYTFHGMNVGWGMVNAGLACWGVLHLHFTAPAGLRLADLVQAQLANENVFLLNAGLDVAYVMTGFFLRALASLPAQPRPVRLLGFGRSLWVQGGFLLVFDVAMWSLLHGHGKSWLPLLG